MSESQVVLRAGIYQRGGRTRTLLAVVDGRCIYGFGVPNHNNELTVTLCSVRTFVARVGSVPAITLAHDEALDIIHHMCPSRPFKYANGSERFLLHSSKGWALIVADAAAPVAQVPLELPEPAAPMAAEPPRPNCWQKVRAFAVGLFGCT